MTINTAIPASLQQKYNSYDISLEPICKAHLQQLAAQLRAEDKQELIACYHKPVLEALLYCWQRSSMAWSLCYRGEIVAVAGVEPVSLLGRHACVWSFTAEAIKQCPFSFWKIAKQLILYFQQYYPYLYAACDQRYHTAQRYLTRLGAQRLEKSIFLADKQIYFYIYQFAPRVQAA